MLKCLYHQPSLIVRCRKFVSRWVFAVVFFIYWFLPVVIDVLLHHYLLQYETCLLVLSFLECLSLECLCYDVVILTDLLI